MKPNTAAIVFVVLASVFWVMFGIAIASYIPRDRTTTIELILEKPLAVARITDGRNTCYLIAGPQMSCVRGAP